VNAVLISFQRTTQYVHNIPSVLLPLLSFAVKIFPRYRLSTAYGGAANCKAATTISYILSLTISGGGIWTVFPEKVLTSLEITILSMIRFGLCKSANPKDNVQFVCNQDISIFIEAGSIINDSVIMANSTWKVAQIFSLAHSFTQHKGKPSDSYSQLPQPAIYLVDLVLFSFIELCECYMLSGYIHWREVDDGLWVFWTEYGPLLYTAKFVCLKPLSLTHQ